MVTVRMATIEDRSVFLGLWAEYLKTQEDLGDFVRATDRTLDIYDSIFVSAVSPGAGVVVIAEDGDYPCGALMRRAVDIPFDTTLGKTVMSFGVYVRKEFQNQGIAKQMADIAATELRRHGFQSALTEVVKGNELSDRYSNAVGYETVKVVQVMNLRSDS